MIRNKLAAFLTALVIATLGLASQPARAQSVMIKPKFAAGDTIYIDQTREMKQKIENAPMGGGTMEIESLQVYGLNRKIESASDGGTKFSMTFDRVVQKYDSPMGGGTFDSDNPGDEDANQMMSGPFKAIIGGTFRISLGTDGQVKECSGMKEILEKIQDAAPGNPMAMQLETEFSDERGKLTYWEAFFLLYPNKEVKVGDTWKKMHHDTLPRVGKVITNYEYKLDRLSEEAGRKVAVITYKTTMERDPSGKNEGEHNFFGENPVIKGSGGGTATYDIERGLVVKQVSNRHVTIEGSPSGGGKAKAKKDKEGEKDSDDEDDDDSAEPAKPMKANVDVKQTITVLSDAERAKQKAEAAKKSEGKEKKPADKKNAKPSKKAEEDDDDDE